MDATLDPAGDVSVAIVHFRTPEVLADCLHSFDEHQPRRVGEVLVIDNSASERKLDLLAQFPWAKYIPNRANLHYRRANNQAAALATKRYLLFLNPDTVLVDGEAVALLANVLDNHADIGLVGPMLRGDDGLLAPQGERFPGLSDLIVHRKATGADPHDSTLHLAARVDTLTAAALLCRRAEFLALGGFDERASMYWEEAELARKYSLDGKVAFYLPDAFMRHRWRQGGSEFNTKLADYFEESRRLYYQQFFGVRGRVAYRGVALARSLARRARRR